MDYFKSGWDIYVMSSRAKWYTGDFIPEWDSIKDIISDSYIGWVGKCASLDIDSPRVEATYAVSKLLTTYFCAIMHNEQKTSLEKHLDCLKL